MINGFVGLHLAMSTEGLRSNKPGVKASGALVRAAGQRPKIFIFKHINIAGSRMTEDTFYTVSVPESQGDERGKTGEVWGFRGPRCYPMTSTWTTWT